MGKAIIISGLNFSQFGMGKVTIAGDIPIEAISIIAPSSYVGEALQLKAKFYPQNTSQRGVVWSVVDGGEYVTVDASTGMLSIDPSASDLTVKVRATSSNNIQVYAEKSILIGYDSFYTEHDYLVSNGQAQINTGYKPIANEAILLVMDISKFNKVNAYSVPSGTYYSSESLPTTRLLVHTDTNGIIDSSYMQWCSRSDFNPSAGGSITNIGSLSKNTLYSFWWCYGYGEVNLTSKPTNSFAQPSSMDVDFYLFGNGNELSQQDVGLGEYKMKTFMVQNNTATETYMELVPCTLNMDIQASNSWDNQVHHAGENGMWDKIGNKFYGNAMQNGTFSIEDE